MDNFNERIRSMFELFGKNIFGQHQKTGVGGKTKQTKQPAAKEKVVRGASKTTAKTNNSRTSLSAPKTSSVSKVHPQSARPSQEKTRSSSRSDSVPSDVFAKRLLHMASQPAEGVEQHWLSIKTMASNGFHCAAYLIHCAEHNKLAVSKPTSQQAMWMPFMPIPPSRSWEETGLAGLLIILSGADVDVFMALKQQLPYTEHSLIEVYDVQLPHTLQIITRLTWYVRLDQRLSKNTHFKCCQNTDSLLWIDAEDIAEQKDAMLKFLWGTELIEMASAVATSYQEKQSLCTTFCENSLDMAFKHVPRNPPVDSEQQLLFSACLSEKDIERLYGDFLEHCYPCVAMAEHSFKVYMTKYGLRYNDERLWAFFHAFNYLNNGIISFPELLIGLACIDNKSTHTETRAKFVLRYYDVFRRGHLTEDDVRLMIQDMHAQEGLTQKAIEAKLAELLQEVDSDEDPETGKAIIQQRRFLKAIGNHKIRGTSKLCRIGKPICAAISNSIFARAQRNISQDQQIISIVERPYNGSCLGCRNKRPVLEEQLVQMSADGYLVKQAKLAAMKRSEQKNTDSSRKKSRERKSSQRKKREQCKSKEKSSRSKKSVTASDTSLNKCTSLSSVEGISESLLNANGPQIEEAQAAATRLIKQIRKFAPNKGDTQNVRGFLAQSDSDRQHFLEQLELLERVLNLMLKNRRCVHVPSPAYIIGDIHGNLDDLLTLERSLWRRFPLAGPNLVFLGDMVDRGKWSVECAAYLFSLVVLAPSKVTLLRGNHEVRSLQCNYTYRAECVIKYGEDTGLKLWELTNRIFDALPLCAVVDGAVYCAHGGIPRATLALGDIAALPVEIIEPQHESQIAWEILWSDPMAQPLFVETARILQVDLSRCEGFLPNRKRGTAWAFNEEAVDRFLAANGLSHVVRAHEVPVNGFTFHFDKKCATIFSCSHYCGNGNDSAVIFADRDQLRAVRIDTSNNASATD